MSNPMVYLENSVENAAALPPELTRLLALIKNLDDRVEDLKAKQQMNYKRCLAYPPQHSLDPNGLLYKEIADFRQDLIKDDVRFIQWAEEKVSLSLIARDLLDQHRVQVDKDLRALEVELEGISYDMEDDDDPMAIAEQERLERQMALEAEAEERELRRKEEEARRLSNTQSHSGMGSALARGLSGSEQLAANATDSTLQSPPTAPVNATPAARRSDREGPSPHGRSEKRQGPQAAVNVQALGQEDGIEGEGIGFADASKGPTPYMPVLPPGMQTSAAKPQAPGRLLTYADINSSLRGKKAELFWPDDNLWYLIEIHALDLDNNKAQIMYITGETEELQLAEIVQDGHMSLISGLSL